MNTSYRSLLPLILCFGALLASDPTADAAVRIYKATAVAKATYFPANSFTSTGFVIFDTNNPGSAQVVQVFAKTKTYQVNGGFLQVLAPGTLNFFTLDKNNDTILDIQGATSVFQNGNITQLMSYIGAIPRAGFRIGNVTFFQTARSLRGKGSVNVPGSDFFTRTDTFTIDNLSSSDPLNTNAGVALVTAQLAAKGYSAVP